MFTKPKNVFSSTTKNRKVATSKKVSKEKRDKERQEKLKEVKLQLITIETELENERKQRNKLQLERDKLHQFWDISRDQTKQIKKALFDESQQYNETNGKLQNDIGYLNDKIAFLMRDHERELTQINSFTENDDVSVYSKHPKESSEETWRKINEDRNNLLLQKEKEMEGLQKEYEKIVQLNVEAFENEKRVLKSSLVKRHQEEMRKFKLAKIQQFDELLKRHQNQIVQLQESYDTEIKKYLDEIDRLKDSNLKLNEKCIKTEERCYLIGEEKSLLGKQLENLNKATEILSKDLKSLDRIKRDAEMYKKQFNQTKASLREWKEKYEILQQNVSKVEKERDQLYSHFQEAISQIQNRATQQQSILTQQIYNAEQNIKEIQLRRNETVTENQGLL